LGSSDGNKHNPSSWVLSFAITHEYKPKPSSLLPHPCARDRRQLFTEPHPTDFPLACSLEGFIITNAERVSKVAIRISGSVDASRTLKCSRPLNELLLWQFSKIICITRRTCKTACFGKGLSSSRILSVKRRSLLEDKYVLKYVSKCRNSGLQ
jgi:hypothetical protein